MPFIKLANTAHRCPTPVKRDDGSPLQVGDEWQCDSRLSTVYPNMEYPPTCNKKWRWTMGDQREPNPYWTPIREVV